MDFKKKLSVNLPIKKNFVIKKTNTVISEDDRRIFFNNNNNYIEYFIEVGIKPSSLFQPEILKLNTIDEINKKLKPEIISKFPNLDKKYVVIDNVIVKTIFPKGIKCIETKNKPDPEFYSIILDNQLCNSNFIHKYISCLIIYENFTNYISLYFQYINMKMKDKKILEKYNQYYIPKCIAIVSLYPNIDKFEEILRSIYGLFLSKNINNLFLEEIIMKLVIEIPRIPRGLSKVFLKFPDKTIDLTEKKMNELPSIHFNISQAIGHFSLDNLIDIYTYLLLETRMIFFSSKIQELSSTILSFLFLLSPLKYQYQIVSILPRELFHFCKSVTPFIFGINESYYPHYFSKNKIDIEDSTICVVDIDGGNYYMIAPGGELDEKEFPDLPTNLRQKLGNKMNNYYQQLINDSSKKNNVKDDNEKYQNIFYTFMIYLFKDYSKYLKDDYGVRKTIKLDINYMIDLDSYIKSKDESERNFYQKILNTQMFIEFIYKRMMPKDCGDKLETLFFEEKIYEKKIKKKFFSKYIINEETILLSSTEYDYDKKSIEIIDLSKLSNNSKEIINYFIDNKKNKDNNLFDKNCLSKGFYIEKTKIYNKLKFNYFLFPLLINEKLFKINKINFHPGKLLYKNIEKINAKIVNKIHLKLEHRKIKNSEIENDNYLSYLIIWSLTFWYTDKEEREFRFNQMIEVLDRIEEHEIEICEILLESVVKNGTEDNIRLLYKKFIDRKLNPSWKIFSLASKYLKSNHKSNYSLNNSKNSFSNILNKDVELSSSKSNKNIKNKTNENKKTYLSMFRLRTLKNLSIDENIMSDDVEFVAYSECKYCKNPINLAKLCSNLSFTKFRTDKKTGVDKIKCPNKTKDNKNCDRHSEQKLSFQFGVELFNQDIEDQSTCSYLYVPLLSPTTIKKKLLSIATNLQKDRNFNVELFKKNYTNIFWNCLWYFQLNNMEVSFMLPYANNTNITNINDFFDFKLITNNNKDKSNNIKNTKKVSENIEIFKLGNDEYRFEDLCKQNVFQFSIIKRKGFKNYNDLNTYTENIGFNEFPLLYKKVDKKDKQPKKGLRASFWFAYVNRIIDQSIQPIHHTKNKTVADINSLIKDFDLNNEEEEVENNNYRYRKNLELNKVEIDYKDENNINFVNTFKKRGTLTKGLFTDGNYLKLDSLDFV